MTQMPKRRGRPRKEPLPAAVTVEPWPFPTGQTTGQAPEAVAPVETVAVVTPDPVVINPAAQSLAQRIWDGQSPDLARDDRLSRVRAGLERQGYTMDGIEL